MTKLYVVRIRPEAKLPFKAHSHDSGFDLHYCGSGELIIPAGERRSVPTGLRMTTDPGYFIKLESRSGSAFKKGIELLCGVGDLGYKEEYFLCLHNSDSSEEFRIQPGERVAQAVILPLPEVEVREVTELPDWGCLRNGGLGSSGK